jgi:hypothetical protein
MNTGATATVINAVVVQGLTHAFEDTSGGLTTTSPAEGKFAVLGSCTIPETSATVTGQANPDVPSGAARFILIRLHSSLSDIQVGVNFIVTVQTGSGSVFPFTITAGTGNL